MPTSTRISTHPHVHTAALITTPVLDTAVVCRYAAKISLQTHYMAASARAIAIVCMPQQSCAYKSQCIHTSEIVGHRILWIHAYIYAYECVINFCVQLVMREKSGAGGELSGAAEPAGWSPMLCSRNQPIIVTHSHNVAHTSQPTHGWRTLSPTNENQPTNRLTD